MVFDVLKVVEMPFLLAQKFLEELLGDLVFSAAQTTAASLYILMAPVSRAMSVFSISAMDCPFSNAIGLGSGLPFKEEDSLSQCLGVLHLLDADFFQLLGKFSVVLIFQLIVLGHILGDGGKLPGTGGVQQIDDLLAHIPLLIIFMWRYLSILKRPSLECKGEKIPSFPPALSPLIPV
jgi:hypothetical protein